MREKVILILLILLSLVMKSQSADSSLFVAPSQDCEVLLSKNYLKSYWNSGLTVLGQPLHYDWKDWTIFGGVAAVGALTFVYDEEIFDIIDQRIDNSGSRNFVQFTDVIGDELFILPSIAGTYLVSAIDKNCHTRNLSLALLQSFIYAEVASASFKILTCRLRPVDVNVQQSTHDGHIWLGPFATFESSSFPSGHAMRSFALATTVAGFYSDNLWVGIVSYSLAAACSAGRLISREHWASDVIVGAALGYFIGRGVVVFNEKIGNLSSVEIQAVATDNGLGFAIKF